MVERAFTTLPSETALEYPQRFTVPEDSKGRTTSYNTTRLIAAGSFALVYEAKVAETGEKVAIKRVLVDRRFRSRELELVKQLKHPNIVPFRQAFYSRDDNSDETFLSLVMDYLPSTVHDVTMTYLHAKQLAPPVLVKLYTYQMLRAVSHLHTLGICHRDVKPQNLLVDPDTHVVKLCDFGSAKKITPGEPNVAYICSRYYRAPELIIGATNYTTAVDIWSCGCVCAEMMIGTPIFPGENSVDQMVEVMKVLGTPSPSDLRAMNPAYTQYHFPVMSSHHWTRVFRPKTPEDAIDFVSKLLVYDPSERPKAFECLRHPFFDELRNKETKLPNGEPLPDLFCFTPEEQAAAGRDLIAKLKPEWYGRD